MLETFNSFFDVIALNSEINEDGKHEIRFDPNFPLDIKEYSFIFDLPVKPNYHDYLEILYVLDDKALIQCGEDKYHVCKGDLMIIGKNIVHGCTQSESGSVNLLSLQFLPELVCGIGSYDIDFEYIRPFYCKSKYFKNHIPSKDFESKKTLEQIERIISLLLSRGKNFKIKAKWILLDILVKISDYYEELPKSFFDNHYRHLSDIRRLRDVFILLEKEYGSDITLEKAAKTACLNKFYFSNFFRKTTGFTFTNYLQRLRIEKAKDMLINNDELTIARIAYLAGFNNLSFFNRTFKKFSMLTPSQFRNRRS